MRHGARPTPTLVLAVLLAVAVTACGEVVSWESSDLELVPQPDAIASTVVDADGNRLAVLRREYRERVRLEDVPQVLVDAVVAAEDQRFWEHEGVDARGILRAALRNVVAGEVVEGGSTISQQLVELRFLPPTQDTVATKAAEAALALQLEEDFPKEWILEEYLNTVYLGGGAHGVGAAAWSYFRLEVDELSLAQAALLAGLIRTPGTADPRVSSTAARARRDTVLSLMAESGAVTAQEAAAARAEPIVVRDAPPPPPRSEQHVVAMAVEQLLSAPAFGDDEGARSRRLTGDGLTIHTTITPAAQASARRALADQLDDEDDPDGAVVTLETTTGAVVAIVGSLSFEELQFDLARQAVRQPGSVVKGFTLTAALTNGRTASTIVDTRGGPMPVGDGRTWVVRGSGRSHSTLQSALRRSDNGAFARLGLELGIPTVTGMAQALGITSDMGTEPALLLGGTSTCCTPLEVATAYATLGAVGTRHDPFVVSHVTDSDGQVVWRADDSGRVVVDEVVAFDAVEMLTGVVTAGTGRAAAVDDHVVAGKTGTTSGNTDGWFVGTTPSLTTAVWIGHHDARRTAIVDGVALGGGSVPARVFADHMTRVLGPGPGPPFVLPERRTVTLEVDVETGLRAGPWCGETEVRTFADTRAPTSTCPSPPPPPPPPSPSPVPSPTASPSPGPSPSPTADPTAGPTGPAPSPTSTGPTSGPSATPVPSPSATVSTGS